jgi:hypothetical protein
MSEPARFEAADDLWRGVYRFLDDLNETGVQAHDLVPLAAKRWREIGRDVPHALLPEERATRAAMMIAPRIVSQAREAYDGRLLVIKGPEVAALYPGAARSFNDIDLLVEDAGAAQKALIAAGFSEIEDPEGEFKEIHHLPPVVWPQLPIQIEVHDRLKWPERIAQPPKGELFEAAVPSAVAEGVEAPAPHHHALILAAHSWAHTPLRTARDLIDVLATAERADAAELARTADSWGLGRVWRTTENAARFLLGERRRPAAVSVWARHLITLREPTVFEGHFERWVSSFWMLPPRPALAYAGTRITRDFGPRPGEPWRAKAPRLVRAGRDAFRSKSEHGWIGDDAHAPPKPRRPSQRE